MSRKWMSPIVLAVLLGLVWLLRGQGFPDQAPAVPVALLDGGRVDFSQPQGQVRLVSFWSTSCAPCIRGMPALADTHHRYQARGLDVVAVAMSYDAPSHVQAFTRREALPFRVGFDPGGARCADRKPARRTVLNLRPRTFAPERPPLTSSSR
jgi:peroxiredoxin